MCRFRGLKQTSTQTASSLCGEGEEGRNVILKRGRKRRRQKT